MFKKYNTVNFITKFAQLMKLELKIWSGAKNR